MATKVGVARYEKGLFFSIFELLQPFPPAYIEKSTVNGKFYMVLAFIKREIMRRYLPPWGVTMETIRVLSQNGD